MIINKTTDLASVAKSITCNSEIFGDEVMSVISSLTDLLRNAEEYGCAFVGTVNDCWGGSVVVTAVPSVYRHSWTF